MRMSLIRISLGIAIVLGQAGLIPSGTAHVRAAAEAEKSNAAHPPSGKGGHDHADAPGPMTATEQDVDLAIWSLITFCVFVFVLKKYAWGPLIGGLDKREGGVLDNIAAAEAARIKAEKMLAEHAAKLAKVQDEVREILAEARRDAEHAKNDIVAAAQKEAEASRVRAVQDIERARDQALDNLFDHMGRCVSQATEQVIGRALTGADNERLIDEALSNFAQRKH